MTMKKVAQKGFTLVEVLLYLTIIMSVISAMAGFIVFTLATNAKNGVIADIEQQANQVMTLIEEVGQGAVTITSPSIGTTGSTLSFTTPTSSPAVFTQSTGVITLSEGGGAPIALTNSHVLASGFSVNNLSTVGTSGTVRVQFTLSYVNNSGRNEFSYSNNYTTSVTSRY